ncbi:tyrosine-type recombinase/integrase, partial [archaeon]|nr:tyrosine-type recombinase/integrase [archaeon]
MMGIHDWNKKYEYALNRLESSGVSVENKELVKGFVNFSLASGLSKARIERYLYVLRYFGLRVSKCFKDMVKADFVKLIGDLEATDYKLWTKVTYKTVLRKFIAWVHDSDDLPSCVSWINVSSKNVKRLPEEILTQDEIKKLIAGAKYERDKALISTLYESGCRIGELGNLLIKHVQFDKHGA